MKWTFIGAVLVNTMLKIVILYESANVPPNLIALYALFASGLEHAASSSSVVWAVSCYRFYEGGQSKFMRKLYFAVTFPEYLKLLAIFLQFFESELPQQRMMMMLCFGMLLASIQLTSLQSLLNQTSSRIILSVLLGSCVRLVIKLALFNISDASMLGLLM